MAELTVPQIDFSAVGQLPQIYKQAQADQVRQQTLASLGQGGQADATALLKSGDLSLAQLGINLRNRQEDQARQATQDARQAQRDQVSDQHWSASFGLQKRTADRQDQTPLDKVNERIAVLKANGIDPSSPEGKAYALSGDWTGPGAGGASLNPVYGVGPDGKPAMVQTTKTGQAIQTKLPEGFQISREPIKMDVGTAYQLYDPQTRQPIGAPIPKDIAGSEREKTLGDETAKAQVALPQVLANSQQILKTIDDVQNHPGKKYSLGLYSKLPTVPGTSQADFRAAAGQLKGQTFLQAYQTLRGGGAITDVEGAKGENALARLDQAQSEPEYDKALNDFKDVIKGGMLRAAAKARGAGAAANAVAPITQADYEKLPSGSPFTAPDGSRRIKP